MRKKIPLKSKVVVPSEGYIFVSRLPDEDIRFTRTDLPKEPKPTK